MRLVVLCTLFATQVFGQRPVDVRGTVGAAVFADESAQVHRAFGGSARFYVAGRFAIEPEVAYLALDSNHHDWLFMPNLSFDLRSIEKRVIPYVIGGVGYLRTSDRFFPSSFNTGTWIAEGGAGVKIYLSRGAFIAPEFRAGSELHIRATASIGYTFGR